MTDKRTNTKQKLFSFSANQHLLARLFVEDAYKLFVKQLHHEQTFLGQILSVRFWNRLFYSNLSIIHDGPRSGRNITPLA
jgi:hypothetical protein